jgi:AcrR family transcriptional regulator
VTSDYDAKVPGRPRDPTLDGRILQAAREVYARHGWSGFTVKAVAATAGASRDTVGRRFESRQELLLQALMAEGFPLLEIREGQSLYDWLLEVAAAVFDMFIHSTGRAFLRTNMDADSVPELFAAYRRRLLEPAQVVLRQLIAVAAHEENRVDLNPSAVVEDVLGPTLLLALMNPDIAEEDESRLAAVRAHLPGIVTRALSPGRSGRPAPIVPPAQPSETDGSQRGAGIADTTKRTRTGDRAESDRPTAKTGAGRPRNPQMEQRVRDAACRLYGRVGWAGFTIDTVAREAHVGKSSIYLRWPDNTALLLDTLEARIDLPTDIDTGSVRGDLLALSLSIFRMLTGDAGDALLRLSGEARLVPELAPRWEMFMAANVSAVRNMIRRAIDRHDLSRNTSVTLLLDALIGGILMQCLTTPPARIPELANRADEYCAGLVDLVLASATR